MNMHVITDPFFKSAFRARPWPSIQWEAYNGRHTMKKAHEKYIELQESAKHLVAVKGESDHQWNADGRRCWRERLNDSLALFLFALLDDMLLDGEWRRRQTEN